MPRKLPRPANANRVTASDFKHIGMIMLGRNPATAHNGVDFQRSYREMFGCSPRVCVTLWRHADARRLYNGAHPQHVLWALLFLKIYATNIPLCAIAGCCRATFTLWIWRYIPSIARLRSRVVSLCCFLTAMTMHCPLTKTRFGGRIDSEQEGLAMQIAHARLLSMELTS